MRYRRANLIWAPLLVLSAGLSLSNVLTPVSGWLWPLMIGLAYPAGRRMASLSLALSIFVATALIGIALAFGRAPGPTENWIGLVFMEFAASVLPWWVGRYQRLGAEQRKREHGIVADHARLRERARIAQDMHDSLGHELALIAVHAGALELAANLSDQQRQAMSELRAGAVRATERLHEAIRVLGSVDAAAELQPPDESIDSLVRRAAAAGLPVQLHHDGPAPAWPPMTSQAAHRVVRESLTNAARHAPNAPVTVTIARQDDHTRIEVLNEAPAQPGGPAGTRQGLFGLDERVRLAGGRFDAGPRPGGGWAVSAVLPDGPRGPVPSNDSPPGFELRVSTRLTRRRQLQTAALPIGAALVLAAALVVVQLLSVARTGLSDDRYAELRLGQPRTAIEPLLPPRAFGEVPKVIGEPPRPAGATCMYYEAGTRLLDSSHLYQLCFAGDVLVSKDRLERG